MEIDILATNTEINFATENLIDEIAQNVKTICSTAKYSVSMDRLFGIDTAMLDRPTPKAMASLHAELIQAIKKYEPRCKVKKISFEANLDGKLSVKVRIAINEE